MSSVADNIGTTDMNKPKVGPASPGFCTLRHPEVVSPSILFSIRSILYPSYRYYHTFPLSSHPLTTASHTPLLTSTLHMAMSADPQVDPVLYIHRAAPHWTVWSLQHMFRSCGPVQVSLQPIVPVQERFMPDAHYYLMGNKGRIEFANLHQSKSRFPTVM